MSSHRHEGICELRVMVIPTALQDVPVKCARLLSRVSGTYPSLRFMLKKTFSKKRKHGRQDDSIGARVYNFPHYVSVIYSSLRVTLQSKPTGLTEVYAHQATFVFQTRLRVGWGGHSSTRDEIWKLSHSFPRID